MARNITKEIALKICKKLEGREISKKNAVHDVWGIFFNGQLIAQFGIRRGSNKEAGHDHVPRSLNINAGFAKQIGTCTKYRDDYLAHLRERGLLPPEAAVPQLGE
ncbi:MAG: hypothetical protein LAO30_09630 [Acidobacteriia bacterium]|nr:hypothetical protein [Terriglobia bacterium]